MSGRPTWKGWYYRLWYTLFSTGTTDILADADLTTLPDGYELVVVQYQQLNGHGSTSANRSAALAVLRGASPPAGQQTHDTLLLTYVNGTFVSKGTNPLNATQANRLPDTAYARAAGDPTQYLVDSGPTWLVNPLEWAAYGTPSTVGWAQGAQDSGRDRRTGKFTTTVPDGWFLDNLGWGVAQSTYVKRADGNNPPTTGFGDQPLDPITGAAFTNKAWADATVLLGSNFRCALARDNTTTPNANLTLVCNGSSQGSRWFDSVAPLSVLAKVSDGLVFESWLRSATSSAATFQTEADWILDLNAVIDVQNRGHYALLWCKVWEASSPHAHVNTLTAGGATSSSADDDGDLAAIVKVHKGFVASFLLCTNGQSFAHFRHDNGNGTPNAETFTQERVPKDRWWDFINFGGVFGGLGPAVDNWNSAVTSNGTLGGINAAKTNAADGLPYVPIQTYYYKRRFRYGLVAYNPTSSSVTAQVVGTRPSGVYTDVTGGTYTADSTGAFSVTMAANTGVVLIRTA